MRLFKMKTLLASLLLLAATASGIASSKNLCEGFLPPNDLKIPVGNHSYRGVLNNGGLTEAQFNSVMDRIQSMYGDVVKQRGGNLVINRLWTDATVNSSAEQQGSDWILNMYGGIARHPDVTYEGEALIACHEMGHHLGGAPKISGFGGDWASNEGGADYFATLKCLRTFFAPEDNASIIAKATIDPLAKSQCEAQFSAKPDQDICMRISLSGESIAYLFQDLRKEPTRPKLSTPDTSQVSQTFDDHPATQCRMDTYFNGSICNVAATVPNSDTDFKVGTCVQGVDSVGYRPRCWFSPDSSGGQGSGLPTPGQPGQPGEPPGPGQPGACPFGDESLCQQICQLDPTQPFCKK